jgi:hypothetical protein
MSVVSPHAASVPWIVGTSNLLLNCDRTNSLGLHCGRFVWLTHNFTLNVHEPLAAATPSRSQLGSQSVQVTLLSSRVAPSTSNST